LGIASVCCRIQRIVAARFFIVLPSPFVKMNRVVKRSSYKYHLDEKLGNAEPKAGEKIAVVHLKRYGSFDK